MSVSLRPYQRGVNDVFQYLWRLFPDMDFRWTLRATGTRSSALRVVGTPKPRTE